MSIQCSFLLHNEELKYLYSSPNIFRVIKSRRIRLAGHVARIGEGMRRIQVLGGGLESKRPLGMAGVDGRIILRWIFMKWDMGIWTRSSWFRIGTGGGHL